MMAKIGNLQKMMTSLDIFTEKNGFKNLSLAGDAPTLRHPVYMIYISIFSRV